MKKQATPDYRAENKRLKRMLRNERDISELRRKHIDTQHDCFKGVLRLNDELSAELHQKLFEVEVLHSILIRAGVQYNISEEKVRVHKALNSSKEGDKRVQ